jgi:hypothetical protein
MLYGLDQNDIVWDATQLVEFSRKHTASVTESLDEMQRLIAALVQKRDERKVDIAGFGFF